MDGPAHYRKAEELAAKAAEYLGRGDGQDSAAVWAAVAQVHATLALAAATTLNPEQQAADVVFQPSPPAGAGWRRVDEKESTRIMRETEPVPDPPPLPEDPVIPQGGINFWSSLRPKKQSQDPDPADPPAPGNAGEEEPGAGM